MHYALPIFAKTCVKGKGKEEKGVLTQEGSYGIGGPLMMMVDKTLFLECKGHNLQA